MDREAADTPIGTQSVYKMIKNDLKYKCCGHGEKMISELTKVDEE